jgi:predicted GNAT superfamily acetyltransferase
MESSTVRIRALMTLDEMYEAVNLQRVFWGNDVESVVPAQMLYTIVGCGGHVLAAFDGDKMVGVLIGLIGTDIAVKDRPAMANLLIASKRMVVLPEYRSGGIGYRLKLAQRDAAIRQGIRLVTWTFDPLQSKNAHLNLRKLGGISKDYQINAYGTRDETGLSRFGWSDRLKVQWWVTHRRVEERLHGQRADVKLPQYLDAGAVLVNPTTTVDGTTVYAEDYNRVGSSFALLEIPRDFDTIASTEPQIARGWQQHIREAFVSLLNGGYFVSDFLTDSLEGRDRAFYLFSADMGFDFSSPN